MNHHARKAAKSRDTPRRAMAPPLTVVQDEKGGREWKPAEYEDEPTYSHLVEIAKTGRARCRRCVRDAAIADLMPETPFRHIWRAVCPKMLSRLTLRTPMSPSSIYRCSELIAKDTVRVGVPIKWRGGEYGWISSWQHPTCLRVPDVSRAELATQIHGLNDLSAEDRKATLDELTSKDAVQLDTIDPDDPSFSKRDDSEPVPRLDAPRQLTRPLLGFQQEGLGWMVANEAGPVNGGILADEMGMGKTIQTIALLLHQKEARAELAVAAAKNGRSTRREDARAPTLVVVPTSALAQWEDEIRDCVAPGALRVAVYYADRKSVDASTLQNADVILTTYPVVEGEWRKCVNRAMVPCRWCGKKLLPRSLVTHLKYFCGPDAVRTAKLAKREKTRDVANEKAMRTLRIKKGDAKDAVEPMRRPDLASGAPAPESALPTPGNFYRELMTKAGRPAMSMYDGAIKARQSPGFGGGNSSGSDSQVSDSDVKIIGETKPAIAESDAENEAVLRAVMEISRREAEERDAAAAASSRPSRGRGKPPPVSVAKRASARAKRGEPASAHARDENARGGTKKALTDNSDDDEWLPDDTTPQGMDAATRLPVKLEAKSEATDDAGADEDAVDLSDSLLHTMEWDRIVLDEAHKIKARTTNTAKCIYDLRSKKKWCLTGTPLQNRVGELYSLVRFLRMDPHAYYFCKVKGCECKSLCWNFGPEQRACRECGHAGPRHYSHFNQTVINPINRYGYVGDGRKGFLTLRNEILLPAQLRRTKAERAADVQLPSLTIDIAVTQMDEVERDFYESLYMLTRAKFDGYVKKGSVLHNYAHIFELLSRLRQACDHPYLVVHSKSRATAAAGEDAERGTSAAAEKHAAGAENGEACGERRKRGNESLSDADDAFETIAGAAEPKHYCGMCQDSVDSDDAAMTGCKHVFHRECITQYASCAPETGKKVTCPTCRVPLTVDLQPSDLSLAKRAGAGGASAAVTKKRDELPSKSILSRIDLSKYTSSTKVEALLRGLRKMRDEDLKRETERRKGGTAATTASAPNKAIVFSQYTSMIEIVEWRLKKENFVIAKLLGSMPVTQRAANLRAFREDPSVTVILMSLKSGGEGLNLQTANRVFVLEPWWNPAVEMQAVMRAHRIGQMRPVIATRFCTADTIEERMFDLQKKKALVFEGCMDGNQASLAQLTEEDLQFLFKR